MTVTKYPAKENLAKVAKNLGLDEGVLFFKGDIIKERHDTDVELEFRQESNFYYITGYNEPNAYAMYDLKTHKLTLIVYNMPEDNIAWLGKPLTESELLAQYDVDEIRSSDDLVKVLNGSNASTLHTLRKEDVPAGVYLTVDTTRLADALVNARIYKSAYEIEHMRKINHISSNAHIECMKRAKHCKNETELEAIFRYETWRFGARFQSYTPIVAAGTAAATLHYTRNNRLFAKDRSQLCLLDCGAELDCYASDITRTIPLSGKFEGDAKILYEIVLDMTNQALAAVKPGAEWEDIHRLALRVGAEGLQRAGVLRQEYSIEEMTRHHVPNLFFTCGVGHMIGLDVHDVGGFPYGVERFKEPGIRYLRMRRPLEVGFVVTVEPGIYFTEFMLSKTKKNPELAKFIDWDVLESRFQPLGGVRIEDCVVVTEDGHDNLTIVPKEIAEIEALMA
ncbi:MAG: peptidase M24, structural domain-containing protein [Podila humilis]|nr:MAG: peptidase M24, structural domain-containing protein [Podila humilis]